MIKINVKAQVKYKKDLFLIKVFKEDFEAVLFIFVSGIKQAESERAIPNINKHIKINFHPPN